MLFLGFSYNALAHANTPHATAKEFVLHALEIEINALINSDVSEEERLNAFMPFVQKNIDVKYLVKFTTGGRKWRKASDNEKARAIYLMRTRIAKLYIKNFKKIQGGSIVIQRVTENNGITTIKSKIRLAGGGDFNVSFIINKNFETFRIQDVIVENIRISSIVKNHFRRNVKQDGIAGLIKKLENEIA